MIVSDSWVWLHFPKCAGTTIELILRRNFGADPAVKFDPIDPENIIWHHNVSDRQKHDPGFSLGGRKVLSAIRRLPDWLLSRVHFEAARGPGFHVTPREALERGRFTSNSGVLSSADYVMRRFSIPRVDHWLRVEKLNDDLCSFFGAELDLKVERLNKTRIEYIKDRAFWFTPEQMERIYRENPLWASVEKAVYGDLLV